MEERRKRAVKELMILKKMTYNVVESEKLKVAKLEGELKVEERLQEILKSELEAEKKRGRQAEINASEEKPKRMKAEADLEEEMQRRKKAEEEVGKLRRLATANEMKQNFLKRYAEKEAEIAVTKKLKLAEEELHDVDEWSQWSPDTGGEGALVDTMEAAYGIRGIVLGDEGSSREEKEGLVRAERKGMMSLGVTEMASGTRGEEAMMDERSSRVEAEERKGVRSLGVTEEASGDRGVVLEGEETMMNERCSRMEVEERKGVRSLGVTEEASGARGVMLEGEEAMTDERSSRVEVEERKGMRSLGVMEEASGVVLEGEEAITDERSSREEVEGLEGMEVEVASRSTRLVSEGEMRGSQQFKVEEELWMGESQGTIAEVSHSSF